MISVGGGGSFSVFFALCLVRSFFLSLSVFSASSFPLFFSFFLSSSFFLLSLLFLSLSFSLSLSFFVSLSLSSFFLSFSLSFFPFFSSFFLSLLSLSGASLSPIFSREREIEMRERETFKHIFNHQKKMINHFWLLLVFFCMVSWY